MPSLASARQPSAEVFFAGVDAALARQLQRRAKAGELQRIAPGVYALAGSNVDVASRVRRHWQMLAGCLVPGAVVSHISALTRGLTEAGYVTLSHPTRFNRTIKLPGVDLVLLKGAPAQPGDLPLGTTDLYWASRHRALLENLGRVTTERPTRAGKEAVEERLVAILNASGEAALNRDAGETIARLNWESGEITKVSVGHDARLATNDARQRPLRHDLPPVASQHRANHAVAASRPPAA